MTRAAKLSLAAGLLLAVLAGGWFVLSAAVAPVQAEKVASTETLGSGMLDGMTFSGVLGQVGKPGDVKDSFVFANGTFVSTECNKRCGYPAQPYYVRQLGDKIEFVSQAHCLHKDATIVWRGTVHDGTLAGVFTWTVNRWYWTIEREFWFKGTLVNAATSVSSVQ